MTAAVVSTRRKGSLGEENAAAYLERAGWTVLDRNFRTRRGEIDIICRKGDQLAFVEVKAWGSLPRGELEHSIDARKRARIVAAARAWLETRKDLDGLRVRFDVLFLDTRSRSVDHIENAFGEGID